MAALRLGLGAGPEPGGARGPGGAGGTAAARAYDVYVDALNGNDARGGTTPGTALRTFAALAPKMRGGVRVGLARGALFRDELRVVHENVTVGAYGVGEPPRLDCADVAPAASFTPASAAARVYRTPVAIGPVESGKFRFSVWESGFRLKWAADLAACEATPGSFTHAGPVGGGDATFDILIHPRADDDPRINGRAYEITRREYGVYGDLTAAGLTVRDLTSARNGHNNGYCVVRGDGSRVRKVVAEEGQTHNLFIGPNVIAEDCVAWKIEPTSPLRAISATMFVGFVANATNVQGTKSPVFRRCWAINTDDNDPSLLTGFYAHTNRQPGDADFATNVLGTITVEDCAAFRCEGFASYFDGARMAIKRAWVEATKYALPGNGTSAVDGMTFVGNHPALVNQYRLATASSDGAAYTIRNLAAYLPAAQGSAFFTTQASFGYSANIEDSTIVQMASPVFNPNAAAVTLKNSIVFAPRVFDWGAGFRAPGKPATATGNLYSGPDGHAEFVLENTGVKQFPAYAAAYPTLEAGSTQADPRFLADPAEGDFRLKADSPATASGRVAGCKAFVARPAWDAYLPPATPVDVYVDGTAGNNANDGATQAAPVRTLARATALARNNARVYLKRGSVFREMLRLTNANVRVDAYGDPNARLPVIDASNEAVKTNFAPVSGHANVYSIAWTHQVDRAANSRYFSVWEDGVRLTPKGSLAECQSTPGSFYYTPLSPGFASTIAVNVHPRGGTNPATDAKRYEITARDHTIRLSGPGCAVRNVRARRNGHGDGCLIVSGANSTVASVVVEEASVAGVYIGPKCVAEDSVVYNMETTGGTGRPASANHVYVYSQTPGFNAETVVRRCFAIVESKATPTNGVVGFYAGAGSGSLARVIFEDCRAFRVQKGFACAGDKIASPVEIRRAYLDQVQNGVEGANCGYVIDDITFMGGHPGVASAYRFLTEGKGRTAIRNAKVWVPNISGALLRGASGLEYEVVLEKSTIVQDAGAAFDATPVPLTVLDCVYRGSVFYNYNIPGAKKPSASNRNVFWGTSTAPSFTLENTGGKAFDPYRTAYPAFDVNSKRADPLFVQQPGPGANLGTHPLGGAIRSDNFALQAGSPANDTVNGVRLEAGSRVLQTRPDWAALLAAAKSA